MPYEVVIPRLGLTMEAGVLAEWYVEDGEAVAKGDLLFAVETDKALQEVEAPAEGIVHHRPGVLGRELPIGTLIGYIAAPEEDVAWPGEEDGALDPPSADAESATSEQRSRPATERGEAAPRRASGASPAARRRAAELGLDWREIPGSSKEGHVLLQDVENMSAASKPEASPVARRAAEELNIDLGEVAAAFPGVRLTRRHVEQFDEQGRASAPVTVRKLDPIRRRIAKRMSESAANTVAVTLTTEADGTELWRLRQQLRADAEHSTQPLPSYTDLLAKLVSEALGDHPELNARLEGEEIVIPEGVHIGLAVDTDQGLLVPVIRNVEARTVREIAELSSDVISRAREGQLAPDELSGSTFTITNLGMYEIDAFTPIINLPNCAILGLGRTVAKQVVTNADRGMVEIRRMMTLSLTFDHRIVDGAPAARFLQRVKKLVEEPYLWLVT